MESFGLLRSTHSVESEQTCFNSTFVKDAPTFPVVSAIPMKENVTSENFLNGVKDNKMNFMTPNIDWNCQISSLSNNSAFVCASRKNRENGSVVSTDSHENQLFKIQTQKVADLYYETPRRKNVNRKSFCWKVGKESAKESKDEDSKRRQDNIHSISNTLKKSVEVPFNSSNVDSCVTPTPLKSLMNSILTKTFVIGNAVPPKRQNDRITCSNSTPRRNLAICVDTTITLSDRIDQSTVYRSFAGTKQNVKNPRIPATPARDTSKFELRTASKTLNQRLLCAKAGGQTTQMSLRKNALAVKEPFSFAKFSKLLPSNPFQNRKVFALNSQETPQQVALKNMGNSSLKGMSSVSRSPRTSEEQQYIKRSMQRRGNGQREVHRNMWRAEKRALSSHSEKKKEEMNKGTGPRISKRATYKKVSAKNNLCEENKARIETITRVKEVACSMSESLSSSLLSRTNTLTSDVQSQRSDAGHTSASLETFTKCPSCDLTQLRLSKSYAQKGAIVVALEKTQRDLSSSQKRVKELEMDVFEIKKGYDEALATIRALESELLKIEKVKSGCLHDLDVRRKRLRALEQSDASDSSHVSSIYVSGSQKTLDDGLGEDVSPDDEDYDGENSLRCTKLRKELDFAHQELQRLKEAEMRKQEMESTLRCAENRIIELEDEIRDLSKFQGQPQKEASTQTLRRDGTFTRQPSDKTKIPKRLLVYHSSLPVINDPTDILNSTKIPKSSTNSLSRLQSLQKNLRVKELEVTSLRNEMSHLEKELHKQKREEQYLQGSQLGDLKSENTKLQSQLKELKDNYLKEMVMRKKYFNLVEDLKGKIRVYCRVKPFERSKSSNALSLPDEYTVLLRTQRAKYEFVFDNVFSSDHTQEDIFKDVQSLVQSTLDGYNVCIFAYGQTGSGKTYTLIGNENQPGIGPRAFKTIFQFIEENRSELDFRIFASVFELYNERLIDLLKGENEDRLKIRRDRYGLVYVQGSESREVQNEGQMASLFEEACANRHIGCTKMNAESSRSHLIVTLLIESTNKITGTVLRGKLSIVDLAGSERTGKTAAAAEQLREANSINKSLSALGDVIAALSAEQQHVPYRNNKLTLLMQDSLGSNAKTLMFVTISSSEQNVEESLNSLTYASRVKQIKNSATRMAESKEISRLRSIIVKMSKDGQNGKVSL